MLRPLSVATSALTLLSFGVLAQSLDSVPTQTITRDPNDWPMYNRDVVGTRLNPAETTLTPQSVSGLQIIWRQHTAGDVYATPSVVKNVVYAGDTTGTFYALDASTGTPRWQKSESGPITASALVTNGTKGTDGMVIFGDQAGFIYGLDRETGERLWPPIHPNPNSTAAIYGSPILVNGQVVIGISSNEKGAAKNKFRGSVVSLNPNDGTINWQTYLITDEEYKMGSSGAGVWSTPTFDAGTDGGTVYVTTGNNYTGPATETSDAFVALNVSTGKIKWIFQAVQKDKGQIEADIGDSPQVYTLSRGDKVEKVVGAGQKQTGVYWVLDANTGELVNHIQAVPSCKDSLGLFADSATSGDVAFVNGVNCSLPANPSPAGEVIALKSDASEILWDFPRDFPDQGQIDSVLSGVAVANGVVYFHTSGPISTLYALDATTGHKLAQVMTNGGISGPSISNGHIYVGTGTFFASQFPSDTFIVAIGLSP